jgi:hypothetical protein
MYNVITGETAGTSTVFMMLPPSEKKGRRREAAP